MKFDDSQMNKCLKLFSDSIKSNIDTYDDTIVTDLSYKLTLAVYNSDGDVPKLVRSKCFNLRDKNNPALCRKVYTGQISPNEYINMSDEQMKSVDLIKEEKKILEASLYDIQIPGVQAETDLFKCAACGQRKSTYRQLQTRSADEPMTTFVTCVCGHNWRF